MLRLRGRSGSTDDNDFRKHCSGHPSLLRIKIGDPKVLLFRFAPQDVLVFPSNGHPDHPCASGHERRDLGVRRSSFAMGPATEMVLYNYKYN